VRALPSEDWTRSRHCCWLHIRIRAHILVGGAAELLEQGLRVAAGVITGAAVRQQRHYAPDGVLAEQQTIMLNPMVRSTLRSL